MMPKRILAVVMACAFAAAFATNATAEQVVDDEYVWLFDDGADNNVSATTDWRFYVELPAYVALDDSDTYWNFTCYAQMVNNTGSAATGDDVFDDCPKMFSVTICRVNARSIHAVKD